MRTRDGTAGQLRDHLVRAGHLHRRPALLTADTDMRRGELAGSLWAVATAIELVERLVTPLGLLPNDAGDIFRLSGAYDVDVISPPLDPPWTRTATPPSPISPWVTAGRCTHAAITGIGLAADALAHAGSNRSTYISYLK